MSNATLARTACQSTRQQSVNSDDMLCGRVELMHYYRLEALSWFGQAVQALPSRSTYISVFRDNVFFDYLTGNSESLLLPCVLRMKTGIPKHKDFR